MPSRMCATFFYPKLKKGGHASVKRWTKVDIFDHAVILVPVLWAKHRFHASIDMQRKAILYHNCMEGSNEARWQALFEYVKDEHLAKKEVMRKETLIQINLD